MRNCLSLSGWKSLWSISNSSRFQSKFEWYWENCICKMSLMNDRADTQWEDVWMLLIEEVNALEAHETAQAVFPMFVRALHKYLRITRQHGRYALEHILQWLALSISYDLGPRAFLTKFLSQGVHKFLAFSAFLCIFSAFFGLFAIQKFIFFCLLWCSWNVTQIFPTWPLSPHYPLHLLFPTWPFAFMTCLSHCPPKGTVLENELDRAGRTSAQGGRTEVEIAVTSETGSLRPTWRIVSDSLLNRCLEDGSMFLLKEGRFDPSTGSTGSTVSSGYTGGTGYTGSTGADGSVSVERSLQMQVAQRQRDAPLPQQVTLLCIVRRLPSYTLREQPFLFKTNRFSIKLQSESTV